MKRLWEAGGGPGAGKKDGIRTLESPAYLGAAAKRQIPARGGGAIQSKTVLSSKHVNTQPTSILHCGDYACSALLLGPWLMLEIDHIVQVLKMTQILPRHCYSHQSIWLDIPVFRVA